MKLIASDLDGTLLNGFHTLDKRILRSIDLALENEYLFVVATGRTYHESALMMDFNARPIYFINNNGALITDVEGNILFEQRIPKEIIQELLSHFPDVAFDFITKDENFVNVSLEEYIASFQSITGPRRFLAESIGRKVLKQFIATRKFDNDAEVIIDQPIIKVNCRMTDSQKHEEFNYFLSQLTQIENQPFTPGMYELTYKGVSKGNAVEHLRQKHQIHSQDVYVFGDGGNDLDMLAKYQNSYATRNAIDEAKEVATYSIGYNWNYAVPREIKKIVMKNKKS